MPDRRIVYWRADLGEHYGDDFLDGMVGRCLPTRLDGTVRPDAVLVAYEVIDNGKHCKLTFDVP